ncbi:MAG: DsbA family protein [Terriglobales bacterium]
MKRTLSLAAAVAVLLAGLSVARPLRAQTKTAAPDAALRARIQAFLDRTIGWQSLDTMKIESISPPDASGLRTLKVYLAKGTQHQVGTYIITPDEKEIIEGSVSKLSGDPWADTRAELQLHDAPALGPAAAPVTVVEFSDLECPYCKEEATRIAQLMQQEPGKIRVVFKYFPLIEIHPWSMQAAKAAVCVAEQHPDQFWNFEHSVFDAQDEVTPATAATRLRDFAEESGAQGPAYDACLNRPSTKAAVDASIANGKKLGVESTPTLFINGRMIPGAITEQQLQMLVDHEASYVSQHAAALHGASGKLGAAIKGEQCGECKPLPPIKH